MPFTALVGEKILCMHGGISPHLESLDQLRQLPRPNLLNYTQRANTETESLSLDLIWSDPSPYGEGWAPNLRGTSITFGEGVFNEVCQKLGIELVARAHQVCVHLLSFLIWQHFLGSSQWIWRHLRRKAHYDLLGTVLHGSLQQRSRHASRRWESQM